MPRLGFLRPEVVLEDVGGQEPNWEHTVTKDPNFKVSETRYYIGRAMAASLKGALVFADVAFKVDVAVLRPLRVPSSSASEKPPVFQYSLFVATQFRIVITAYMTLPSRTSAIPPVPAIFSQLSGGVEKYHNSSPVCFNSTM